MSRETRLLRASTPFLAIGLVFVEGIPQELRVAGLIGLLLLMSAALLPGAGQTGLRTETGTDRPRAPPEVRPPT